MNKIERSIGALAIAIGAYAIAFPSQFFGIPAIAPALAQTYSTPAHVSCDSAAPTGDDFDDNVQNVEINGTAITVTQNGRQRIFAGGAWACTIEPNIQQ